MHGHTFIVCHDFFLYIILRILFISTEAFIIVFALVCGTELQSVVCICLSLFLLPELVKLKCYRVTAHYLFPWILMSESSALKAGPMLAIRS